MSKLNCNFIFSNFISTNVFLGISVVLLVLFVVVFLKKVRRNRVGDIGLLLLVSGATINIFERFRFGCVRDYFNFFGLFAFNTQDLLVTAGIILLIWVIWKKN